MKTKKILISILIALALILMTNKVNAVASKYGYGTITMTCTNTGEGTFKYSVSSNGVPVTGATWIINGKTYNGISGTFTDMYLYYNYTSYTVKCTVTYSNGSTESFSFTATITKSTSATDTTGNDNTTGNTSNNNTTEENNNSNSENSTIVDSQKSYGTITMTCTNTGEGTFKYSVSSNGVPVISATWIINGKTYNGISGTFTDMYLYYNYTSYTVKCTVTYSNGSTESFSFTATITKSTSTTDTTGNDNSNGSTTGGNNSTTGGNNNSNSGNSTTGGTPTTTTDTTAPTLTVTYKKPDGTVIQSGQFTNQNVTVTITANETIKSINGWTLSGKTLSKTYTENTEETITVSDSAGNTSKATIKVTQIDKSAPQITGVTNEGVYSGKVTPKVTDANLDKITLKKDGVEQTNWQNEQEITEEGSYEITATDKAGNSTTYSFTIKKISPEDIKIKTEEYKEYTEEKIIAYVEQQETVKNFIEKLKVEPEGAKVVVLDAQGKEVTEEETIKTGMKVKIEDQDTYVISVLGDLNGDGESDLRDVATFVSTLLNGPQEDVIEGFEMAADFNKDGEMALIDLTKMIVTLLENMTTTSN